MQVMTLPKRPLGTSGLNLTTVGFGAWAAGGGGWSFSWGPQDDQMSIAAMRHAIDHGVNWIDTAAVYGLGHSEEVVGRFLRTLAPADRPYVFTKCGLEWDPRDRMKVSKRTLHPDAIRRHCDESLGRLGVERIDLFQFHWPDEGGIPIEDSWEAMTRLVEQGKLRAIGVSNFGLPLLERCEARRHVDSLQPPFSMIKREVAAAQLPWCEAHGTGVICYSPMQSGILTDTFSAERVAAFASEDWRRRGLEFKSPQLERNLMLRDALRPIATRHDTTVGAVAIAWVLSWPAVTGAIVGARSPQQVDGWLGGATLRLDSADLYALTEAIERSGAGAGPTTHSVTDTGGTMTASN
jgi:aryl-alcohol dehydrogenase-like predicted oxidoreductase